MSCDEISINVSNLSKKFEVYERPHHRLLQAIFRGKRQYYSTFQALDDISFSVRKGETVGIIGRNGAGKSTLLQIICGTYTPTSGSVQVTGRVAALLELGAGFNPEFSGKENVYLSASILGLSSEQIDDRYDDILLFADIGDFIDKPVKTYSSGMYVRLAFAVIANVDADILIIDEALSVGDAYFTHKCMRFLHDFKEKGTLLFVSHDSASVVSFCDRAILLDKGKVGVIGDAKIVTEKYLENIHLDSPRAESCKVSAHERQGASIKPRRDVRQDYLNATNLRNDIQIFEFDIKAKAYGNLKAEITFAELLADEKPVSWIVGGEYVTLKIHGIVKERLENPIVGFYFKNKLGVKIFGDNTLLHESKQALSAANISGVFTFIMPKLPKGEYSVDVAIAEGAQEDHVMLHWLYDAISFVSHSSSVSGGLVGIPMHEIDLIVE